MSTKPQDDQFETGFYETVLRHNPKDAGVVEILGALYSQNGRVDDGLRMDRKLVRLMPDNPTAHYNLACSLALKKRTAGALKALRAAVEHGYSDVEWLREDPDLANLQKHPEFEEILNSIELNTEQ